MTEAVVIRTIPLREHDRLAVLYCRDQGRTAAIAKGALRATSRQAVALDDGNIIRCKLVPGRTGTPVVTGAQAQRSWSDAKRSATAWAVASFFLEAVDTAVYDGQPDEALWDALTTSLALLNEATDPLTVLRDGQVRLLEALGYGTHPMPIDAGAERTELDDRFEQVVQRQLGSIGLVYRLANGRF
jgi:DNA repair protein RecO (recombination protein O)